MTSSPFRYDGEWLGFCLDSEILKARVEQASRIEIAHCGKHVLLEVRILLFEAREEVPQRAAHGAGALRTAARHNRHASHFGIRARDVFGDEYQRANEPEIAIARVRHRRQSAQFAREHGVAQQRLAKIVGGVAERDHVRAESFHDFVDGAAAITAA